MSLTAGDIISFERTFTKQDIELFTKVSGDYGNHHLTPDEEGRLVVQGLLTATLPTKVGGDNNVLARTMNFEFLRPVYSTDTIRCDVRIDRYDQLENKRTAIEASFSCKNQFSKEVLTGGFAGIILPE